MSFPTPVSPPFDLQAAIDAAPAQSPIVPTDHLPVTNAGTLYHSDPQSILNIGTIKTDDAAVGSTQNGVDITMTTGSGDGITSYSGHVYITTGDANSGGYAGNIRLRPGFSSTFPGNLILEAGAGGSGNKGGAISLQTPDNTSGGTAGDINIILGTGGTPFLHIYNIPTVSSGGSGSVWRDPITNILNIVP